MENWTTHPEYPDYFISDQGRVARVLTAHATPSNKYPRVNIKNKRGARVVRLVHQLVLEAFVGSRPEGADVRHLNDVPTDNRLENLAYGSRSENTEDAFRNGGRVYKMVCPQGHPIEGKNLQVLGRRCKACNRERANAHWHSREFDPERADRIYKEVMS